MMRVQNKKQMSNSLLSLYRDKLKANLLFSLSFSTTITYNKTNYSHNNGEDDKLNINNTNVNNGKKRINNNYIISKNHNYLLKFRSYYNIPSSKSLIDANTSHNRRIKCMPVVLPFFPQQYNTLSLFSASSRTIGKRNFHVSAKNMDLGASATNVDNIKFKNPTSEPSFNQLKQQ
eukprot:Pgem_evm1s4022